MIDLVGTLADAVLTLRTATRAMLLLRMGVLVSGVAACGVAWLLGGEFWLSSLLLALAAIAVAGSVVVPGGAAPTAAIGLLILDWLFGGRAPVMSTVLLAVLLGLFHAMAALACRGPLHADLRSGALTVRHWVGWALASLVAMLIVVGAAAVPARVVPRGAPWVLLGVAVGLGALVAVLGSAARQRR